MKNTTHPYAVLVLGAYLSGLLISYQAMDQDRQGASAESSAVASQLIPPVIPSAMPDMHVSLADINPPQGHALGVQYGDLGPRLLAAGVIDLESFAALYDGAGKPLTALQRDVLERGSREPVVITADNAYFLLNFFWAVGLANRNPVLTAGPITQYGEGRIDQFASTGGWSLATRPIAEIYASLDLIPLSAEQQELVEEAAAGIFRPCCNNATLFPDCNHGMAMLGLLELMAAAGASADEMFTTAKFVNAFWFPQQALEAATYLKAVDGTSYAEADARLVTGASFSSGGGAAAIRRELQVGGLLPKQAGQGGSCAN